MKTHRNSVKYESWGELFHKALGWDLNSRLSFVEFYLHTCLLHSDTIPFSNVFEVSILNIIFIIYRYLTMNL